MAIRIGAFPDSPEDARAGKIPISGPFSNQNGYGPSIPIRDNVHASPLGGCEIFFKGKP